VKTTATVRFVGQHRGEQKRRGSAKHEESGVEQVTGGGATTEEDQQPTSIGHINFLILPTKPPFTSLSSHVHPHNRNDQLSGKEEMIL